MAKRLWAFLNSKLGILVLGFVLTGVAGTFLSDRLQKAAWQRQADLEAERRAYEWDREKTFQLLRYRLEAGLESLQRISETLNRRLFLMERVYNTLASGNQVDLSLWAEYMDAVTDWNIKLKYFEEDLRRLVGEEFTQQLNNYETDGPRPTQVVSIHGKFFFAHRDVNRLRACGACANRGDLQRDISTLLRELNYQSDAFIARAGDVFLAHTAELERFKFRPER